VERIRFIRHETPTEDPLGDAAAPDDPAEEVEQKESYKRALAILARLPAFLPPRLAAVFTRYEIDGIPMPEIAAELGIKVSTNIAASGKLAP
jgi:DNA-directed RNA polymerase specialized sigma24 family protein